MSPQIEPLSILIVEDNPADLFLIEEMLRSSTLKIKTIHTADRSTQAGRILRQENVDIVFLDLSLPDSLGIDSYLNVKRANPKIPVIILTGLSDSEIALKTLKQGAQDYLVKGEFESHLLVKSLEYSIERKKAEEQILASEQKYRQMFYKNPFPAWIYDIKTLRILEVNDAAIEKYGYEREAFLIMTVKDLCTPEEIRQLPDAIAIHSEPEKIKGKLWHHKKKNGDTILVEITGYEIDYFGRKTIQVQINDVTEKIKLEKELADEQQLKQQQITDAVLCAQEKERVSIGQELHDNINQILAASRIYLDESLLREPQRTELIKLAITDVGRAIEEVRKLSKVLIIPGFIKLGLKQSIEDLIIHIQKAQQLTFTLDMDKLDEKNLNEHLKINLYRIIQEQLNNILKYAEASVVTIRMYNTADSISLSVTDNGKGFDPSVESSGVGFTNINSRAGLFNGKVEIESAPGNGCRLDVLLQLKSILSQQAA